MKLKKIKLESIKIKMRKKYIKMTAQKRRKKINFTDFTIISNNCWAGFIYQSYGIPYNTPTLGMFIVSDEYIKFISNLDYYLKIEKMESIDPKRSKWYEQLKKISKFGEYPIAKLGDIELHLLHYNSVEEAEKAWNRRKKRINSDKLLVKFSEMNLCSEKNIKDFQKLRFKNKICFVSKKYENLKNDYTFVVSKDMKNQIKSTDEPVGNSRIVNINQIINNLK